MIGPEAQSALSHSRYTIYDMDGDDIPELIYYTYSDGVYQTFLYTVSNWDMVPLDSNSSIGPGGYIFFLSDDDDHLLYSVTPGEISDSVTDVRKQDFSLYCQCDHAKHTVKNGTHFSTGRYLQMKPFTDPSLLYHPEGAVQETTHDVYNTWIEWNNENQQ